MFINPWPRWLVAFCGKQVWDVKGFNLPELAGFSNQHLFHCSEMENQRERLDFWRAADGGRGGGGGGDDSTMNKRQGSRESGDN